MGKEILNSLISVIVPVYNVEKYLSKCLDSIINQTYKNLEIICVDDGSTDSSSKILEEYAKKDKRIKILSQINSGQGAARNLAINLAKGEYIMFVDSDDWLSLNACEVLLDKILSTCSDFVIFGAYLFDDNKNSSLMDAPYWRCDDYIDFLKDKSVFVYKDVKDIIFKRFSPWNKFYRASFLKNNDIKFDDKLEFEDVIFHMKSFLNARRITYCMDCLYNYRLFHSSSCTERFKRGKECLDIIEVVGVVEKFLNAKNVFVELESPFLKWKIETYIYYYNNIFSGKKLIKNKFKNIILAEFKQIEKQYKKKYICYILNDETLKNYYEIVKNKLFSIYKITNYLYINIFYLKIRLNLRRFA